MKRRVRGMLRRREARITRRARTLEDGLVGGGEPRLPSTKLPRSCQSTSVLRRGACEMTSSIISWGISDGPGCVMRVTVGAGPFAETGGEMGGWMVEEQWLTGALSNADHEKSFEITPPHPGHLDDFRSLHFLTITGRSKYRKSGRVNASRV